MNPLKSLEKAGQAVWLDYIRRSLVTSGELQKLIDEDGLKGMTSNPSIFEKAITGSKDYAAQLDEIYRQGDLDPTAIYERLAIRDIQDAADVMRQVYDNTAGRDGYVSMEVSPYLAHETQSTLGETRRLWKAVSRPNVMIKIPGTEEGIPAIRQATSEGINVNVTLLFAQERYEQVAEAFIAGLEALAARGGDVSKVASVASFFVSRIDTLVDSLVEAKLRDASVARPLVARIAGKVAIANARQAYQKYKQIAGSHRWKALAAKGARTQRLLWASTSTKNPKYSDVMYVEELIGPDTVNTVPTSTLAAFRDHGRVRLSLEERLDEAAAAMRALDNAGISIQDVTDRLLREGVRLFAQAFDELLKALDKRCRVKAAPDINTETHALPGPLAQRVESALDEWHSKGLVRRLWSRDSTLWTGTGEDQWLGWLGVTEDQMAHAQHFREAVEDARSGGFTHALLLGMGGSSLCPEVMSKTFGETNGYPTLHVLDSTDPAQIAAAERAIDIRKTLFIVSSKSGSTLEPNIFKQYFFKRAKQELGAEEAGRRFIAITDPGSKLQQGAELDGFRRIFFGVPSIGGRYSALSDFGMVPAAVMGVDVPRFLDRADVMIHSCNSCVPVEENPGATLGSILGLAARAGRDKVTLIASPAVSDLGHWLEQLLAESTGKSGKGLIPVDREELGPSEVYGDDRMFVYLRLESHPDSAQDAAIERLQKAGHPVVHITVHSNYDLGQEFFRWEFATAVAGSILGINPFNQPDVEASKVATRKLTSEYETTGKLPDEKPLYAEDGLKLFADDVNAQALRSAVGSKASLVALLRAHLGRLKAGDYFATLAYVQMNDAHETALQRVRHTVRDRKRVATCLGFGPRFLHSTGQAYKGGPNTGVFLQITCDDAVDLPVPGQKYTFGIVKAAQARGDFQVLAERNRRALRVHLGADPFTGLTTLGQTVAQALA